MTDSASAPVLSSTQDSKITNDTPVELVPVNQAPSASTLSTESDQESDASEASNSDISLNENVCNSSQLMITRDNDPSDEAKQGVISSEVAKNLLLLDSQGTWGVPQCRASDNPLKLSKKVFRSVSDVSFSCIDGRVKEKGLSALGGDAGEFLLALSVFVEYSKKDIEFNDKEVQRMLEIFLNKMRPNRFYMCTDQDALKNVELAIGSSGFSLRNVKESLRMSVLENVVKSANVGSVHLQKMMGRANSRKRARLRDRNKSDSDLPARLLPDALGAERQNPPGTGPVQE